MTCAQPKSANGSVVWDSAYVSRRAGTDIQEPREVPCAQGISKKTYERVYIVLAFLTCENACDSRIFDTCISYSKTHDQEECQGVVSGSQSGCDFTSYGSSTALAHTLKNLALKANINQSSLTGRSQQRQSRSQRMCMRNPEIVRPAQGTRGSERESEPPNHPTPDHKSPTCCCFKGNWLPLPLDGSVKIAHDVGLLQNLGNGVRQGRMQVRKSW